MVVYSVGTPVNTHSATGSVTGTWGASQFRQAGHLLVAVVSCAASTSVTATSGSAGWANQAEVPNTSTAQVRVAFWTKKATGSDAAPVFTSTETGTAGGMDCMLFELSGANTTTPVDTSGTYASGASAGTVTMTATTSANLAANNEFCIACFAQEAAAGVLTWTDTGTGVFSAVLSGNGVSTVLQTYIGVVNPYPGGVTVNDAGAFSVNTSAFGAGAVVAFAAAPATPAVNWSFTNNGAGTVTSGGTTAPASGTSESWTVSATGAFPAASATAQPPVQFTVADPVFPSSEKMLVTVAPGGTGSGQAWTVIRGTEGTTPVAHAAGFSVVEVTTGGFLTATSKELSARAYVDCDYTGAADASAAFNAALASLPTNISGRPTGTIVFGPGNVKFTITPDNPGPCVYIQGAGKWATFINSYVTGGDAFRVFDPTAFSTVDPTVNGGGIADLTIRGDNAGAGATGLHVGDIYNYKIDIVVLNFQGTGSKGVWFDNEWYWTEMLHGRLYVSGCTSCVVFDNPPSGASTSGSSFSRIIMTIGLGQGVDGTGQVWGDGVVLQNGALITGGDVQIIGQFSLSAAATSAAVIRLTGAVPAGHLAAGRTTAIVNSRLHVGVECDTQGANTFGPMTISSDGTAYIAQCYGQLNFGSGNASFAASNLTPNLLNKCLLQVNGDNNLGAAFQVFDTEQFQVITAAYTLANSTSAQKLLNATANGAVTVPPSTSYFFECEFDITGLSGSAHTLSFGFGGTATYTSVKYVAHRIDTSTALSTAGAWTDQVVTTNAATALTGSVTTTIFAARISGIIRVNAGGTVIPQVTQGTASAAAVVGANSWIRLTPVGTDVTATAGSWS